MLLNLLYSSVDTVSEPVIGSVLYYVLTFGFAAQPGIYIGDKSIVRLDCDDIVNSCTPAEFLDCLVRLNRAINIYVSCSDASSVGYERRHYVQ
jgi:hypothetical protein